MKRADSGQVEKREGNMAEEKLTAARKAFAAYERAIAAAREALAEPPRSLGTTIMSSSSSISSGYDSYACSECEKTVSGWSLTYYKFCPHCGAEIVRWDDSRHPITEVGVTLIPWIPKVVSR